jgi:hypothetical protein
MKLIGLWVDEDNPWYQAEGSDGKPIPVQLLIGQPAQWVNLQQQGFQCLALVDDRGRIHVVNWLIESGCAARFYIEQEVRERVSIEIEEA